MKPSFLQAALLTTVLVTAMPDAPRAQDLASSASVASLDQVHGTVFEPSGKRAPDATVTYACFSETEQLVNETQARAASDGSFSLVHAPIQSGEYDVLVAKSKSGISVLPANATAPVAMHLRPRMNVRVQVVDSAGHPVEGVTVCPEWLQPGTLVQSAFQEYLNATEKPALLNSGIPGGWSAVSDAQGMATLSGLPANYILALKFVDSRYVQAPDSYGLIRLVAGEALPVQQYHMLRAASVAGVVQQSGTTQPLHGLKVIAQEDSGTGGGSGTTDSSGRYQIEGLEPGQYSIALQPIGQGSTQVGFVAPAKQISLSEGENSDNKDIAAVRGALISGRVTDSQTKQPLAKVVVVYYDSAQQRDSHSLIGTMTDSDGNYHLTAAPGPVTLTLYGHSYAPRDVVSKDITVQPAGAATVDFQVTSPQSQAIRGMVVDSLGKPVADATVAAIYQNEDQPTVTMKSDAQGQFQFISPKPNFDYTFTARKDNLATANPVPLTGNGALKLVVAQGSLCAVHGVVTEIHGAPLAGASVTLSRVAGGSSSNIDATHTAADGSFRFQPSLAYGSFIIAAQKPGYSQVITSQQPAQPSSDLVFTARLRRTDSFVAGTVVNRYGKPIPGAHVASLNVNGLVTTTDAHGRFRLVGVPAGNVNVNAYLGNMNSSWLLQAGRGDNLIHLESRADRDAISNLIQAKKLTYPNMHGDGEDANTILSNAERKAASSGKKVFLVFGASWCGPCAVLHLFLDKPAVQDVLDPHFVIVTLDIMEDVHGDWNNPGGDALFARYGGTNTIPFWAILDARGHKLADSIVDGENQAMPYNSRHAVAALKLAAPEMTNAELTQFQQLLWHIGDE